MEEPPDKMEHRLAALVSADIAGYSRLVARDRDGTARRLASVRERVQSLTEEHRGRLADFIGDNFLADFSSALDAVRCALEIHRVLAIESSSRPADERLLFRMGIHLGEVVVDRGRIYGDGVTIAARLEGLAEPGGLCLSGMVHDLVRDKLGLACDDLGDQILRGVDQPVAAYRVPAPSDLAARELGGVPAAPPRPAPSGKVSLIERRPQLERLQEAIDRAREGHSTVTLIAGEAGIGKTSLAEAACRYAESRGTVTAVGRGHARRAAPAYWPWIEILRRLDRDPDLHPIVAAALADEHEPLRRLLAPERPSAREGDGGVEEGAQDQFELFDSFVRLLARCSEEKLLVLVLDDLHWIDPASLALLEFAAGSLRDSRIAIFAAYRAAGLETGGSLSRTVLGLSRLPQTERLVLRGISRDGAALLLGRVLGAAETELVDEVHRRSEGNPFFIHELAHHMLASEGRWDSGPAIPETIRELIEARLEPLGERTRGLLAAAAVLGRRFDAEVLADICAVRIDELESLLEEAVRHHLLSIARDGLGAYRFSHALISDSLYSGLASGRRARLHAAAAAALELRHAGDLRSRASDIAHHFRASLPTGDREKAIAYARLAGQVEGSRYAYAEAAQQFESAVELAREGAKDASELALDLLLELAESRYRAGGGAGTFEAFQEVASLARERDDSGALARAALGLSGVGLPLGVDIDRSRPVLEEALRALGDQSSALTARVLARLATMPGPEPEAAELALERSARSLVIARVIDDPVALTFALDGRHTALDGRHTALDSSAQLKERIDCARQLVTLGQSTRQPERQLIGHYMLIVDFLERGDLAALDREIDNHERLAQRTHLRLHLWRARRIRAMRLLLSGEIEAAATAANEALQMGESLSAVDAFLNYGAQIFQIRWAQGRLAELRESLESLTRREPAALATRAGLALLECIEGHTSEGRARFDELVSGELRDLPRGPQWTTTVVALSETVFRLGDAPRAASLYELLSPYEHSNLTMGATCYFGAGAHYLGLLATTAADGDRAERHFEDALAMHRKMQCRPMQVRTLAAYGALRCKRGDLDSGRELIAAAADLGDQIEMKSIETRGN